MSEHCFAESGDFVAAPASTLKGAGPIPDACKKNFSPFYENNFHKFSTFNL
jgi:hypothetical protein